MTKANDDVKIAIIQNDVSYIKDAVKQISGQIESEYVTKVEFEPIKRIVYGLVSLILIGVVGAVLALVINQRSL